MDKKTFCIIPWTSIRITPPGNIYPCCKISKEFPSVNINQLENLDEWWNSELIKTLRRDLSTGIKNNHCRVCWIDEEAGKSSLRQEYNKRFAKYHDLNAINKTKDFHNDKLPMVLDLNLGNICNYKCVMCVPELSSKILTERIQHQEKFKNLGFKVLNRGDLDFSWPESDKFRDMLDSMLPTVKAMELKGGEPLLIDNVREAMMLIPNKQECVIALTTNGSIDIDDEFLDQLKEFKKIWFFVSVDGVDEMAEYVRHGSRWPRVLANMEKVSSLKNCVFRMSTVLQFFSTDTFPDIFHLSVERGYEIELLACHNPDFLTINAILPDRMEHFKTWALEMKKRYPDQAILDVLLGFLARYEFSPDLHKKCHDYLDTLDTVRHNKTDRVQALFSPINNAT